MKITKLFIFIIVLFCNHVYGSTAQDSTKKIIIENANRQIIDNITNPSTKYFIGDVRAYHNGSFFYCDSAKMVANQLFAYGNITIIQNDTISIFGDELFYDGDSLMAFIRSKVVLLNDKDKLFTEYLEYDMQAKKAFYKDKAMLQSEKTTLKSKKGTYDLKTNIVHFVERVNVDGEDFYMVTDTLDFDTKNEIAIWNSPAIIEQDTAEIYSKKGRYEINPKKAEFAGDAQYKKKDVLATADKMNYNGDKKEVSMFGNAKYESTQDTAIADTILYFEELDIIKLNGNAFFKNKTSKAKGNKIEYNKKEDGFKMIGRGEIQDSTTFLIADNSQYSEITKKGFANGDVIWRDTSAQTQLNTDSLTLDGSQDYFIARNIKGSKPVLQTKVDQDTMYISAMTISRQRIISKIDSTTMDTAIVIIGNKHVEIFKSDMQGIADSMSFNQTDSIFRLLINPLLWTDTTQLSADTIDMFMKDKKMDHLDMKSNGLVITSPDLLFFNQIRGNKIVGLFKDSAIEKLKVNGDAQCIYYMLDDDDAYIGVNQTDSKSMIFQFENKKIKDIKFYIDPKSTLTPMDKADHEKIKLKGFSWQLNKRPLNSRDVNE